MSAPTAIPPMTSEISQPADHRSAFRFAAMREDGVTWVGEQESIRAMLSVGNIESSLLGHLQNGSAEVVKSGKHRAVYRLELPPGTAFLKHYCVPDWKGALQNIVRPSRARLEWKAIHTVAKLGIPTVTPIALGERKRGPVVTDSFLLTRAVPESETLHDFVIRHADCGAVIAPDIRQQLAWELGALVARLHAAGILHRDLHAGNVLMRTELRGEMRLWLIDLHSVARRRRLSPATVAKNLALFAHFFDRHTTPADRQRFFVAYWNRLASHGKNGPASKTVSLPIRDVMAAVERASQDWSQRALHKADRKWFRGHRKLIIVRDNSVHCRGVAELGAEFVRQAAANPDLLLERDFVDSARQCGRTSDAGNPPAPHAHPKQVTSSRISLSRKWLGRRRRWSRVRTIWEIGHALLRRGVPVMKPLLFVEQQQGDKRIESLLTESVSRPSCDAETVVELPPASRRQILRSAGRVLRQLHDHGFVHEDLAVDSFRPTADGVLLTGLESIIPVRKVSRTNRLQQLRSLLHSDCDSRFTRSDRLRFLSGYLGRKQRGEWKAFWREVEQSTATTPRSNAAAVHHPTSPPHSRRRFLRAALTTAALFLGCKTPKRTVLTRPARHSIRFGQLLVMSNFRLPKNHPVVEDLVLLRKQVTVALDLPKQREDVVVYIFTTENAYREYLNAVYPGLPNRRAYFVGTPDELAVYTYWGDRILEDLRHEYTHGLLHASLRTVPLWIDEGLAEYFEVSGPRPGTVNTEYASRLASLVNSGRWRPNLPALERLQEFSSMQRSDYQEAWAWVHFLFHSSDGTRQVLLDYLHDLRSTPTPTPLSERLKHHLPSYEQRFLAHVATLPTPQLLSPRVVQPAGMSGVSAR